ncbi:MAG: helix-turn-helix domain-containing protein [Bacilli bacterium]|nr:helix-turn-helix domain-containing protein [Bacilli bacterium]
MDKNEKEILRLETYKRVLYLIDYVKSKGYSQGEIAEKIGITEVAMSKYVKGKRIPKNITVQALIDTFQIPAPVVGKFCGFEIDEDFNYIKCLNVKEIVDYLKSMGYKQKEISEKIGITEVSMSRYNKEHREGNLEIAIALYVNYTDELKMYVNNKKYGDLFEKFKMLNDEDKEIVASLIRKLSAKEKKKNMTLKND